MIAPDPIPTEPVLPKCPRCHAKITKIVGADGLKKMDPAWVICHKCACPIVISEWRSATDKDVHELTPLARDRLARLVLHVLVRQ